MEEEERNSKEAKEISEQEKKYVITSIILLFFLIIVLLGLIAEAYINQHPVFEFLQYDAFKPRMSIIGSISFVISYIGLFLIGLARSVFSLSNFEFKLTVIILLILGLILNVSSILFLVISYDLQFGIQNLLGYILLLIGSIGQLTTEGFRLQKISNVFYRVLKYISLTFCLFGIMLLSIHFIQ